MGNLPTILLIPLLVIVLIVPDAIILYNKSKEEVIELSKKSAIKNSLGCKKVVLDSETVWVCPESVKSDGIEEVTCTRSGNNKSCVTNTYRVITEK